MSTSEVTRQTFSAEGSTITVEFPAARADVVRRLIETVHGQAPHGWGPAVDPERAADALALPGESADIIRHHMCRLTYVLGRVGACLITDQVLECERLSEDPRTHDVRVPVYWGFSAELPRHVSLSEALVMEAEGRRRDIKMADGVRIAGIQMVPHEDFDEDADNEVVPVYSVNAPSELPSELARRICQPDA